jgi:hypothetical protein
LEFDKGFARRTFLSIHSRLAALYPETYKANWRSCLYRAKKDLYIYQCWKRNRNETLSGEDAAPLALQHVASLVAEFDKVLILVRCC